MGIYASTSRYVSDRQSDLICLDGSDPIFSTVDFGDRKTILLSGNDCKSSLVYFPNHSVLAVDGLLSDLSVLPAIFERSRSLDSIAFVLPNDGGIVERVLDEAARFLEDNELSIGILLPDSDCIRANRILFQKYSVFVTPGDRQPRRWIPRPAHRPRGMQRRAKADFDLVGSSAHMSFLAAPNFKPQDEPFQKKLLRYMQKSKKTNVEIYTGGGITRQVFSKIISSEDYEPKKGTIICLIVGMELCLDDALDLLNAAGFTLSHSIVGDCIVEDFIKKGEFDLNSINLALDEYGVPPLGWKPR